LITLDELFYPNTVLAKIEARIMQSSKHLEDYEIKSLQKVDEIIEKAEELSRKMFNVIRHKLRLSVYSLRKDWNQHLNPTIEAITVIQNASSLYLRSELNTPEEITQAVQNYLKLAGNAKSLSKFNELDHIPFKPSQIVEQSEKVLKNDIERIQKDIQDIVAIDKKDFEPVSNVSVSVPLQNNIQIEEMIPSKHPKIQPQQQEHAPPDSATSLLMPSLNQVQHPPLFERKESEAPDTPVTVPEKERVEQINLIPQNVSPEINTVPQNVSNVKISKADRLKNKALDERWIKLINDSLGLEQLDNYLQQTNDAERVMKLPPLELPDNSIYEGEWLNGVKQGFGMHIDYLGTIYSGDWKNDKKDGVGSEVTVDGVKYFGRFEENEKIGKATVTYPNGESYNGEVQYGLKEGYGEYEWADKKSYKGYWWEDRMEGLGTMEWPDKRRYEGTWQAGQMSGNGQLLKADGSTYKGGFHEGKENGTGILTTSTGEKTIGEWQDGNLIEILEDNPQF
jgi:hypothetical protein